MQPSVETPAIPEALQYFSADYQTARSRLIEAAKLAGHAIESFLHPLQDAEGRELAMDAIWCGSPSSDRMLIVSSGLHGLEGPLGSACQLAALQAGDLHRLADEAGWRVLLLHALNPFGYAYCRRWNEDNVDLNRNFWLPEDDRLTTSIYSRLAAWLNPKWIPWHDGIGFYIKSMRHIWTYGFGPVKQAIGTGQFDFPQGLLYGGHEPAWTRQVVEEHMPNWIAECQQVDHIDVHSGLGKWGRCKLLLDYSVTPDHKLRMRSHPVENWEAASPDGTSYNAVGTLGRWCDTLYRRHNYLYMCAEVGTYNPVRVLRDLRTENQQWHHAPCRSPSCVRRVQESFCPRSMRWRRSALNELWGAIVRTIKSP